MLDIWVSRVWLLESRVNTNSAACASKYEPPTEYSGMLIPCNDSRLCRGDSSPARHTHDSSLQNTSTSSMQFRLAWIVCSVASNRCGDRSGSGGRVLSQTNGQS